MKNLFLQRKGFIQNIDLNSSIGGYNFRLPLFSMSKNKSIRQLFYNDFLIVGQNAFKDKKYLSNILMDNDVKKFVEENPIKTDFLIILSTYPEKTQEAIRLIRSEYGKECFIIVSIAFTEEDIEFFKEADGIVVGQRDSIFSSKYNKFDVLKRLLNKVDEYNKISIASIDIEDKYDYVKCVILGADLVDYNFKITTKEIKHAFVSTMCLSKAENLKQLKEIKYIEE